ncbi:MAG: hypothetical protein ACFFDW_00285 [Candidatus Thorarchaeota archaeon]
MNDETSESDNISILTSETSDEELTTRSEQHLTDYYSKSKSLKLALLAIFTALGPVLSISFIWFPYFELMTLTIFIGGIILGPLYSIFLAILSTTLFELIVSVILGFGLPIYPFKVLAFIIIALTGSLFGKVLEKKITVSWTIVIASLGGILTFLYDILVTVGLVIFMEIQIDAYLGLFISGIAITAIRVATNTVLFAFVPVIFQRAIKPLLQGTFGKRRKAIQNETEIS